MITIILLSRNSPLHVKRALFFYKKIEFKGRIIVADSSKDEIKKDIRDIVTSSQERLFAPLLLEYDTKLFLSEKMALASQEVATPYAVLAGADDFFSPQTMYEAMWFLKHNPDYAFAYGKMYGFTLINETISCYYTGYFDKLASFENNSPIERLKDFFPRYSACFNAVIRTEVLQNAAVKSSKFLKKLVTTENLYMMLLLLEGKSKFIPKPFHWRELSDGSDGTVLHEQWLVNDTFKNDFFGMKKCLEEVFIEKKLFSEKEAVIKSNQLVDEFFSCRYILTFPKKNILKDGIKHYVPKGLLLKLFSFKSAIKNNFINAGESYIYNKKSPYFFEFELMKTVVKESGIQSYKAGLKFVKQV